MEFTPSSLPVHHWLPGTSENLVVLSCPLAVTSQSSRHIKTTVREVHNYIAVAALCARVK